MTEDLRARRGSAGPDERERTPCGPLRELLLTLRLRVVSHRREIEAALVRLADDAYGNCLECGKPIDAGRLRALPWTERCRACEAAMDPEAQRRRG